jgi:hypothetical protein
MSIIILTTLFPYQLTASFFYIYYKPFLKRENLIPFNWFFFYDFFYSGGRYDLKISKIFSKKKYWLWNFKREKRNEGEDKIAFLLSILINANKDTKTEEIE